MAVRAGVEPITVMLIWEDDEAFHTLACEYAGVPRIGDKIWGPAAVRRGDLDLYGTVEKVTWSPVGEDDAMDSDVSVVLTDVEYV